MLRRELAPVLHDPFPGRLDAPSVLWGALAALVTTAVGLTVGIRTMNRRAS